jgi:hypothetical protein
MRANQLTSTVVPRTVLHGIFRNLLDGISIHNEHFFHLCAVKFTGSRKISLYVTFSSVSLRN